MLPHLLFVTLALALLSAVQPAQADPARDGLKPCRLSGVEHDALCGVLRRPLDPAQPQGTAIDIHFAVLPALARNRKPDALLFFAGGPGQSALEVASSVSRLLARANHRRDIVLIDQRGTGRSAPLVCDEIPPTAPLAGLAEPAQQLRRLQACRARLQQLPHGDLRHYSTWIAMQDADAVRQRLGLAQVNIVGVSYGTRAALEYMRQFPATVRRAVIDGVAPPDGALPAAMSTDNQAALDAVLAACRAEAACQARYPTLAEDWRALLAALPREVVVQHPMTGLSERVPLTRDWLLSLVRTPLYAPALAAGLPMAVSEAARGRFEPLLGLASALQGRGRDRLAEGMHFAVICAEDLPRLDRAADAPGADFGHTTREQYQRCCEGWPRGEVPAAFYTLPPAPVATLVLSGGADPVTPPRHGERVAKALGTKARHVVVPQAGHGVLSLGCMRDVLFRFVDAATDGDALQVETGCAAAMPRPPAFLPLRAEVPR